MRNKRYNKKDGIVKNHFYEHKILYIILLALFTIGFIVGSVNSAFLGQDIKQESDNYILTFVEQIKTKSIDNNLLFKEVILSNLRPIIYVWIFGLIIIGIPLVYIYIILYGYSVGFTVASVLGGLGTGKGSIFLITALIPQEIIFIPIMFFIALNAILFSKDINSNMKNGLKNEIVSYIFVLLICIIIVVGISLFQTYIGTYMVKNIMNVI